MPPNICKVSEKHKYRKTTLSDGAINMRLTKKYFVVISFAVAQAASRLRLSVANGEIYNTNMYKDVSTPVGLST